MTASWLLLNKPAGITSFDAINPVKKALASGKVGHTGTLDKFAQGLMIVLTGSALKLSRFFSNSDKRYEASVFFGTETDTLDTEGRPAETALPPSLERLQAALPLFQGEIKQRPPIYSAIHLNGVRAHTLARAGAYVQMPERSVNIYELKLLDYTPPVAKIAIHCSKGTYIRSLARDIALSAGSRAHLAALVRTQTGAFRLEEAISADTPENIRQAQRVIDKALFDALGISTQSIDNKTARAVLYGQPLSLSAPARGEDSLRALFHEEALSAVVQYNGNGRWIYLFVIPKP